MSEKSEKAKKAEKGDKPDKAQKKEGKGGDKKAQGEKKAKGKEGKGEKAEAKPVEVDDGPEVPAPPPRLREKYKAEIVPALMKRFGYTNTMQVPRLKKIVVNMGLGEAVSNPKIIDSAVEELTAITGQKPIVTRSKKSIANFKLRQGLPIGAMVTLRRERMWEFFDRLVTLSLPRVRDFRGTNHRAFDGAGNYTLGLKEQIVFPEIDFDKVDKIKGMNITIVTSANTNEEAKELLAQLGMPFRN
jgi:large subunit ribosomal protein L5